MWNYLVESYRNKCNRPLSFFINWMGLTLGLAAVTVIYLYVMQEVRHDRNVFVRPMTNVYRVATNDKDMGKIVPTGLRKFVSQMPEVEAATFVNTSETIFATEGQAINKILRMNVLSADSTFFNIFPLKMVSGTHASAMAGPNDVAMSRSAARKLFDTEDVVGLTLKFDNRISVQIAAVYEDIPVNSTFSPEIITSIKVLMKSWGSEDIAWMDDNWGQWNFEVYLKTNPNVKSSSFKAKYLQVTNARLAEQYKGWEDIKASIDEFQEIYFSKSEGYSRAKTIDPEEIKVMGLIALLVLAIAIINYVNIYTARATEVIRAMGIKSIMGAKRMQLIGFVIFDSVVITFVSAVSAVILAACLEPFYIDIIGSNVMFTFSWDIILMLFVVVPLVCGVISGIFPAIALTRMKPLDAMANRSSGNRAMGVVRNALIVLQFTISIALIGSTLFINKQMRHVATMKLGYNRENVYFVQGGAFMGPKFQAFRAKLLENPGIKAVSFMKNNPISIGEFRTQRWGDTEAESMTTNIQWTDQYALSLLGVRMIEGDSLLDEVGKGKGEYKVIVNETMAKAMRAQNPSITFPYKHFVGVFADYQSSTVKEPVRPLVLASIWSKSDKPFGDAYIKLPGDNLEKTLDYVDRTFHSFFPDQLYEGKFLDEHFNYMYTNENLFRARLLTFSILAVFISCLGLFALVSYNIERCYREIAIRKVYGSTIMQIIIMLIVSFLKWLVASFVIAAPLIYYIAKNWIDGFQYKTNLSWWVWAVALGVAFVVAILTVIGQAYKAATEDPSQAINRQ